MVKFLLLAGAHHKMLDKNNMSAFDWAKRQGHKEVADYIKRIVFCTATACVIQ